jgi:alpha-L-fucosidase
VHDGDSGCLVQRGASDVEIIGNHWARCRVGLLAWDAGDLHHRENACVDLSEAPFVEGP